MLIVFSVLSVWKGACMIVIVPDLLMCFMLGIFGKWQCACKLPFLPGILYSGSSSKKGKLAVCTQKKLMLVSASGPGFQLKQFVSPV